MPTLNRLPELLALAAVVCMSSADMARAQTLVVPNPFSLSIAGAGSTASNTFTVTTSPPTTISLMPIDPSKIATSGASGNWLCATASGAVITYSAGIGCNSWRDEQAHQHGVKGQSDEHDS